MASFSFSDWACKVSQRTNISLAGSSLHIDPQHYDSKLRMQANQWGMQVVEDKDNAKFDTAAAPESFVNAVELNGKEAIDNAQKSMPVLQALMKDLKQEANFNNIAIAVCLILEPKTAVLLRQLHAAGAKVGVFCEPDCTDQRVADALRDEGIIVEADSSWNTAQAHEGALRLLDELKPDIIIDDGASFARLVSLERPELLTKLIGVAEETTSGIRAFENMIEHNALQYPVIAVNDSPLKTCFDNAHGTGETCVTTMQAHLGAQCFMDKQVAVIGFGPVGKGFADRIRALGADVIICDSNPIVALRATFEGYQTANLQDILQNVDMVISATGVRHTVTLQHLQNMKSNTIVGVIGGIANEIALDEIPQSSFSSLHDPVCTVDIPQGNAITLIAQGDGVNYTVGGGNPIEIMDFSFAVQVSAVAYLLKNRGNLSPTLHRLSTESDERIALLALQSRNGHISEKNENNGYDWTVTRFTDTNDTI
ncbi:MAG: adenosylhomocysteinase [Bifidobacteriaceae bacterium]|nr:adenosylhomocysteinase [Bifidobacteriaceae bacterium]